MDDEPYDWWIDNFKQFCKLLVTEFNKIELYQSIKFSLTCELHPTVNVLTSKVDEK